MGRVSPHALQGGGARLPLLPRAGPAAAAGPARGSSGSRAPPPWSACGETRPMRSKEEAHDYRHLPAPDPQPRPGPPGEVAVVVRLLLGAHGAGLAASLVEEPRLLPHLAARLDHLHLAAQLVLHRLPQVAKGVHVLELAAGAQPGRAPGPD